MADERFTVELTKNITSIHMHTSWRCTIFFPFSFVCFFLLHCSCYYSCKAVVIMMVVKICVQFSAYNLYMFHIAFALMASVGVIKLTKERMVAKNLKTERNVTQKCKNVPAIKHLQTENIFSSTHSCICISSYKFVSNRVSENEAKKKLPAVTSYF